MVILIFVEKKDKNPTEMNEKSNYPNEKYMQHSRDLAVRRQQSRLV
jgi:hypothetical protein